MKIRLETVKKEFQVNEPIAVRLLVLNDGYTPLALDRRLLIGPNPVTAVPSDLPHPVSVEPAFSREEQNILYLNPWTIYGRQRNFQGFTPGRVNFYAYLLKQAAAVLQAEGPGEAAALLAAAEPLTINIR